MHTQTDGEAGGEGNRIYLRTGTLKTYPGHHILEVQW